MEKNMGHADGKLRTIAAIVFFALALFVLENPILTLAAWVVATILALTGFLRICPLYRVFGINTCDVPTTSEHTKEEEERSTEQPSEKIGQ